MQCTTCLRQAETEDHRCKVCGGLMVEGEKIDHQNTVAVRAQIQPLRAELAGCKSPVQRQALRRQIAELSAMAR